MEKVREKKGDRRQQGAEEMAAVEEDSERRKEALPTTTTTFTAAAAAAAAATSFASWHQETAQAALQRMAEKRREAVKFADEDGFYWIPPDDLAQADRALNFMKHSKHRLRAKQQSSRGSKVDGDSAMEEEEEDEEEAKEAKSSGVADGLSGAISSSSSSSSSGDVGAGRKSVRVGPEHRARRQLSLYHSSGGGDDSDREERRRCRALRIQRSSRATLLSRCLRRNKLAAGKNVGSGLSQQLAAKAHEDGGGGGGGGGVGRSAPVAASARKIIILGRRGGRVHGTCSIAGAAAAAAYSHAGPGMYHHMV